MPVLTLPHQLPENNMPLMATAMVSGSDGFGFRGSVSDRNHIHVARQVMMGAVHAMASPALAFPAEQLTKAHVCEATILMTAEAMAVAAIVGEGTFEVDAAPAVPPAVITAKSAAAKLGEILLAVKLWSVEIAAGVSALHVAAAELTLQPLVEAKVAIQTPQAVPATGLLAAKPFFKARSVARGNPTVIAAQAKLTEPWEIGVAVALDLAVAVSASFKGVVDADQFASLEGSIHVCRLDSVSADGDVFDRGVGGVGEEFLGITDRCTRQVVEGERV
jgi:hypothetical protein